MTSGERIYQTSVRAFSIVIAALGAAILALTLARGGGPLSAGVLMGVCFLAVGMGRLYIARRQR
jgi:hypothetical protein